MNSIVIGLGSMGQRRIRLLKELYPQMTIYGCDNNGERAELVREKYQIQLISDFTMASQELHIKYAFVCTAPLAHGKIIEACLEQGWHIFSEINLVSDHYEENINAARQKGQVLFLSSTPIYRNEMQYIMDLTVKEEKPVQYIYQIGQYLPDWHPWERVKDFFVSDARTNGCRELFAIELPWMIKAFGEIEQIMGIRGRFSSQGPKMPDSYHLSILHKNGNMGTLVIDTVRRKALRDLKVFNENIYCEWQGTPESLKIRDLQNGEMVKVGLQSYLNLEGYNEFVNEYAYMNEIQNFFAVVDKKKAAEYTFEEDWEILKIIDQIEGAEHEDMYGGFGIHWQTSFTEPE